MAHAVLKVGDTHIMIADMSPGYAIVTDKFGVTFQIFTATSEEAVRRGPQKNG